MTNMKLALLYLRLCHVSLGAVTDIFYLFIPIFTFNMGAGLL